MSVEDNITVGKVGIEALAAVSITNALHAVIMVIGFGLTMAVIPLTAMTYGAGIATISLRTFMAITLITFYKSGFSIYCLFICITISVFINKKNIE